MRNEVKLPEANRVVKVEVSGCVFCSVIEDFANMSKASDSIFTTTNKQSRKFTTEKEKKQCWLRKPISGHKH